MEQLVFGALWVSACGGLAAVLLTALTPLLQRKYSARMRCWVWLAIALCMLVPVRPQLSAAPVRITVPEAVTRTMTLAPARQSTGQAASSAAPQTRPEAEQAPAASSPAAQLEQAAPEAPQTSSPAQQAQTAQPEAAQPQTPQTEPEQLESAEQPAQPLVLTVTPVQLIGAAWAAGAALSLIVRMTAYFHWKRRALRACRPLLDVSLRSACARAKAAAGCRTRVRIRVCAAVDTPVVAGALRPLVLLPPQLRADDAAVLVLTHEYTHVRRRDVLLKGAAVLAACVHWFNPAVYVMLHGVSRDVELACDEAVLTSCGESRRAAYGRALIAGAGHAAVFTTQFGGGKRAVKQRLDALFLGSRHRGALTALVLAAAVVCASALAACQVANPGESAMVTRPLDTAIPVTQTELPTYTLPLGMWELESDEMIFYAGGLADEGLGEAVTLTDRSGNAIPVPLRRSSIDRSDSVMPLLAFDGEYPGALVVWVQGGTLNAMVTEDGENWAETPVATVSGAQKLACSRVDAATMFLAAESADGTIIWTTPDGGAPWRQARQPVAHALSDILFFSETNGLLLVNEEGSTAPVVLYTSDGGATWAEASFPDLTQALDMTRIRAMNAAQRDGTLYLQIGARYKEEDPASGEQFGTFVYTLYSADGGASWEYRVRPVAERRAEVNATRSVNRDALAGMMIECGTEEDGGAVYYLEDDVQVPSFLTGEATVIRASGGTVELRQEETAYQREATLVYEGLTGLTVSQGDTVYYGAPLGYGAPDGEGTASFSVRISSGGVGVSWNGLYASTDVKAPPLCEVPEELQEYAERAGGDRVAVAYTLANALLQGDEGAVDDLVFGQYAQDHTLSGFYADDAYRLESLEGFVCSGAWIDVWGEDENSRVLLTLDVESAGTTGLSEGLYVYEVRSRSEAEEYGPPAGTVTALSPVFTDLPGEDAQLAEAVALAQHWRAWNTGGAFNTLDADTLTDGDVLCAALFENQQSGRTEWTAAELSDLVRRLTGVENYRLQGTPSGMTGYFEWDETLGVYRLTAGGPAGRAPASWSAARTDEGADVVCTQFADGLSIVPAYEYTYHFETLDGRLVLRSCSVDSITKLTMPEVPVTGEALSDERALAVCRALVENESRLRAWMFGTNRRVDETGTVQRAWDGVLVTYGRSLDFATAAECAEALQNVCASAEPLALTGKAARVSDGALTEIPLCVEENGRLYTAQAYLNDPYRSVDEQGVKLDYVSDGRIEFTVPVTLQSGRTVTAQYAAVADGGRWVLETLFAADESR